MRSRRLVNPVLVIGFCSILSATALIPQVSGIRAMSFFSQFPAHPFAATTASASARALDAAPEESNIGKICPRLPPPSFTAFSETADLCLG